MTKNRQEPYVAGTLGGTPVFLNPLPPNQMPVATRGLVVKVFDSAGATPLGIPAPIDPDKSDRLVVRITALPAGGQVKLFDRVVLIGDLLTAEQLKQAAFAPDGVTVGDVGALEYQVSDDRGGSDVGSVAVYIQQSNKAPAVVAATTVQTVRNPLNLQPPTDPDGDTMTITVTAVPAKGAIHDGPTILAKGDRIDVAALTRLTYDPEDAAPGAAGTFSYSVDDGRGGTSVASVSINVNRGRRTGGRPNGGGPGAGRARHRSRHHHRPGDRPLRRPQRRQCARRTELRGQAHRSDRQGHGSAGAGQGRRRQLVLGRDRRRRCGLHRQRIAGAGAGARVP